MWSYIGPTLLMIRPGPSQSWGLSCALKAKGNFQEANLPLGLFGRDLGQIWVMSQIGPAVVAVEYCLAAFY